MIVSFAYQVLHSRKLLRAGVIVGFFKIDVATIYLQNGRIFFFQFSFPIRMFHWVHGGTIWTKSPCFKVSERVFNMFSI